MVLWHLLRAARRQLAVTMIGAALTFVAGWFAHAHQGLYQASITVVLLRPETGAARNPFIGRDSSLIATASAVARMVDAGAAAAQTASPEVTLAAQGSRTGWIVRVPNSGGQWTYQYDKPNLDIQAVGSTKDAALAGIAAARSAIRDALIDLQDRADVDPEYRIVESTNPSEPALTYGPGRPTRALVAIIALGVGATLTAAAWLDDLRSAGPPSPWRTPSGVQTLTSRWRRNQGQPPA